MIDLIKQTIREWQEDKASRLAAALAYYTVFSLPPLLIIALAVAGQFYDRAAAQEQLLGQAEQLVGEAGATAISDILSSASEPGGTAIATIISVVTLLLGASGVFTQLQEAMNTIWEAEPKPKQGIVQTIKDRIFSFTLVLAVGFLLLVSLVLSAALAAASEFLSGPAEETALIGQIINTVVSFAVVVFLFAMIYKVVPDVEVRWRDVWIGAIITALLFTIGKWAIGFYLGRAAPGSAYGAAGSLIVLLLWVYYSAQILFLGAEFTQVYAHQRGSRIGNLEEPTAVATESAAGAKTTI